MRTLGRGRKQERGCCERQKPGCPEQLTSFTAKEIEIPSRRWRQEARGTPRVEGFWGGCMRWRPRAGQVTGWLIGRITATERGGAGRTPVPPHPAHSNTSSLRAGRGHVTWMHAERLTWFGLVADAASPWVRAQSVFATDRPGCMQRPCRDCKSPS